MRGRSYLCVEAEVAELVDAHVSGACGVPRVGSSPTFGTGL